MQGPGFARAASALKNALAEGVEMLTLPSRGPRELAIQLLLRRLLSQGVCFASIYKKCPGGHCHIRIEGKLTSTICHPNVVVVVVAAAAAAAAAFANIFLHLPSLPRKSPSLHHAHGSNIASAMMSAQALVVL